MQLESQGDRVGSSPPSLPPHSGTHMCTTYTRARAHVKHSLVNILVPGALCVVGGADEGILLRKASNSSETPALPPVLLPA